MKVLIACREYGVPSEIWMRRQAKFFDSKDIEFLAWNTRLQVENLVSIDSDFDKSQAGLGRWVNRSINFFRNNFFYPTRYEETRITDVLKESFPDVILCHYGPVALKILPIAKNLNIPVVIHFHGNDISSSLRDKYYKWSIQKNSHHFAAAIVVGKKQYETALSLGFSERSLSVIPCGAPHELFKCREDYRSKAVRFICVSRLVPWKGVDYALKAFFEVANIFPEIELHIVGDGESKAGLMQLVNESETSSRVFFHNECSELEVRDLMVKSDVFIQLSLDHTTGWFEGFGVSVTEACLSGLPVIVSNCGGLVDQIENGINGFVVAQRDVGETLSAMKELIESMELRETMGKNAHSIAKSKFDSRFLAKKLELKLIEVCRGDFNEG